MIYYGEEIGMRGSKGHGPAYDEYRREPMDWYRAENGPGMTTWFKPSDRNNKPDDGISVEEEDKQTESLLGYYRTISALRAAHPALRSRDFQMMQTVNGCSSCLGLWRWAEGEVFVVIFNFGSQRHLIKLDTGNESPVVLEGSPQVILGENQTAGELNIEAWGVMALRWP